MLSVMRTEATGAEDRCAASCGGASGPLAGGVAAAGTSRSPVGRVSGRDGDATAVEEEDAAVGMLVGGRRSDFMAAVFGWLGTAALGSGLVDRCGAVPGVVEVAEITGEGETEGLASARGPVAAERPSVGPGTGRVVVGVIGGRVSVATCCVVAWWIRTAATLATRKAAAASTAGRL